MPLPLPQGAGLPSRSMEFGKGLICSCSSTGVIETRFLHEESFGKSSRKEVYQVSNWRTIEFLTITLYHFQPSINMTAAFAFWALWLTQILAAFPDCINGPLNAETVCDETSGESCWMDACCRPNSLS